MFYVSEIRCNRSEENWSFKNCLLCEQFTCQKDLNGWRCSCALNTEPKNNYHYKAIWETELCILAGTLAPGNRMSVNIQDDK